MADNSALGRQWDRSRHDRGRAALFETLVRACLVIVDQELLDHRLQVAGTEDQHVVKHLTTTGADEPLREGVRDWPAVGQANDAHAFRAEDLGEGGAELGVPISEQELDLQTSILELPLRARTWEVDPM